MTKGPSITTYGSTDMALIEVSNQRSYKKNPIILHHGNLPVMHICLYISITYLEHYIIAYDQNRLSFYAYQTIYDHSKYH